MKDLICIASLIMSQLSFGQTFELPLSNDSDTSFYDFHRDKLRKFEIQSLGDSSDNYIWRLWSPPMLLELEKTSSSASGRILTMLISDDKNTEGEIFKGQSILSQDKSSELLQYLNNTGINELPSDKYIENWRQGLDGITYFIEESDGTNYLFKRFWTPSSQNGIPEAELFISTLDSLFNTISSLEKSNEEAPFKAYHYFGASYSVVRIQSEKEARKEKKRKNER